MSTLYEDVKKRDEAKTEVSNNAGGGLETAPAVTYIDDTNSDADERGNIGAAPKATTITPPDISNVPTPKPIDVQPKTMLELVQMYGKPQSYEEEIADAARRKRLGNWADVVANLADLGTGLAGRRLYSPTNKSAAAEADKRLIKLRELQRGDNLRYNNALMDARYKDIQQERADNAAAAEVARKAQERAETRKQQEWANDFKERQFKADREDRAASTKIRQAEADANAAYRKAALGLEQQRLTKQIEQAERNASSASQDYLLGKDGVVSVFPKAASGAIAGYLYNRMKQVVAEDKTGKRTLDETLIAVDANGDTNAKVLNVVRKNISNFPELQAELNQLLEQGVFGKNIPSSTSVPSGSNTTTPTGSAMSNTQPIVYTPNSTGNVSPQAIEWYPGMPIK